jgi:hypothetical protein
MKEVSGNLGKKELEKRINDQGLGLTGERRRLPRSEPFDGNKGFNFLELGITS